MDAFFVSEKTKKEGEKEKEREEGTVPYQQKSGHQDGNSSSSTIKMLKFNV